MKLTILIFFFIVIIIFIIIIIIIIIIYIIPRRRLLLRDLILVARSGGHHGPSILCQRQGHRPSIIQSLYPELSDLYPLPSAAPYPSPWRLTPYS